MKKYLILFLVLSFLFSFESLTHAQGAGYNTSGSSTVQTGTPTPTSLKTPTEISAMRAEAAKKLAELREQAKTLRTKALAEAQEKRIIGREVAVSKFYGAINMVKNSQNKIKTQIPKLKALGIDTSVAETKLAQAQAKLDQAESIIVEANQLLASTGGELSQETKTKVKTMAKEAQTLIKEAHFMLVDTLKMLRDMLKAKKSNPTTGMSGGGYNGPTDGTPNIETPSYACSYAPAPTGCTYVQGPDYNSQNSCGMILKCEPEDIDGAPIQAQACPSYAPAPSGCNYLETGEVNACGPVLALACTGSGGTAGPNGSGNPQ